MTSTLTPTRPDAARAAFHSGTGVLAAVGGRGLWRLWWPLALWLVVAGLARLWLATGPLTLDGTPFTSSMAPGATLLLVCPVAVVLLWAWGARFALGLGLPRLPIYVATALCSVGLPMAYQLVCSTAEVAEAALVGRQGIRVFLSQTAWSSGASPRIVNFATILIAIYGLPLLATLAAMCAGFLGRGGSGALIALVGGALLYAAGVGLMTPLGLVMDQVVERNAIRSNAPSALMASGMSDLAILGLGWFLFRSARA